MAPPKLSPLLLHLSKTLRFSTKNYHPALTPTTLTHLLASTPDPIQALHLFRSASHQKHFKHTPSTYTHLIHLLGIARKTQEMDHFLKEMLKLQYPDAALSLHSLIESFCKHHRPLEALKVFEITVSNKLTVPVLTCNLLLGCLGDLRNVVFVYKEMVKCGVLPNVETLNVLIERLVENGEVDLALTQYRRMGRKGCRANSRTFEVLVCGLCSCGRIDEGVGVWEEMVEVGCGREYGFYVGVLPVFCRVGRLNEGLRVFELMKSDGYVPDEGLCSVLIEGLCGDLRVGDAVEVFDEMGEWGVAPVCCMYVDIVTGYCKLGRFSDAMSFLEENEVGEIEPYNALLRGLCDGGKVREAMIYLRKIWEMGKSDGDSWNILINCLCRVGNVGKAFEVVGRMIVSSYKPDETTHSSIVTGYCKIFSYDIALDWFRQDFVKLMSLHSESCSQLIEGLCYIEKVEEAVEVFYSVIESKGGALSVKALDELLRGLCFMGKVKDAIKVRSIASCNGTACGPSIYEVLIQGLLDLNKGKNGLLPLLSQMLIEGCALDSRTYSGLIWGLCIDSSSSAAAVLFNRMVHDGFIPEPETLEKIVCTASKCSWLHLVVHSLDKVIEGGGLDCPSVCNMLIYGLLKEGRNHEARKYLDWMLDKGWVPDSNTHGLLVGKADVEGREKTSEVYEDGDEVSNILSEGLGNST